MNPYARPNERKVGSNRPKIVHTGAAQDLRTPQQRKAEKETIAAERRAIKKAARRDLKRQLLDELKNDA